MNKLSKNIITLLFLIMIFGNNSCLLAKDVFIYETDTGSTCLTNEAPQATDDSRAVKLDKKAPTHIFILDKDRPKEDRLTNFIFGQEGYIRTFTNDSSKSSSEKKQSKNESKSPKPDDQKNGKGPKKPDEKMKDKENQKPEELKGEKPPEPKEKSKIDLSKLSDSTLVYFSPGRDFLFHATASCPRIKNAYSVRKIKKSETTSYRLSPCPNCFK